VIREAVKELPAQESAMALAEIVMGSARTHYTKRGWDHIVECYSIGELAESIQQLIDMDCPDIPMRNGDDALTWWDGICDGVHEARGGTYGFC